MSRRKLMTSVYLEPDQLEELKLLSAHTGVPMAAYVRRGIARILRAHVDEIEEARDAQPKEGA